jgi:hypothetical protein
MVNTHSLQEKILMTNSDNTFGTFNKITHIAAQPYDGSTALTTFADVAAAKAHFFTTDAITIFDETCTELQWAVINDARGDATSLKWTMAFGTKGTDTAEADDWSAQHLTRKQAKIDAPLKSYAISGAVQDSNGSSEGTWVVTVTATGHDFEVGDMITIAGVQGMTNLNLANIPVKSVATNTFTVLPEEGFGSSHTYTSGGTAVSADKNQWANNPISITTDSSHLF